MNNLVKKALITRKIPSIAKEVLSKKFIVEEWEQNCPIPKDKLIEAAQEYEAFLTMLSDPVDKEILENATQLKIISNYAIGLDNIDVSYAKSKGITVYNLLDIVTESTADLTFAILLSLIRRVPEAWQFVKEDKWKAYDPNLFFGESLHQKIFGIIGYGRISKAVAQRAKGFGMKVQFYHYKDLDVKEQVSLDELYETSDYISLHIPLKEETHHFIDAIAMQKMKKHPVLINMARGAVVDTDALVKALEKGWIRGAALDVTDPEPFPGNHPLCSFENCLIVPHIGSATLECRTLMAKQAAENILSHS